MSRLPMLAETLPTLEELRLSSGDWLVSPKIDGIRCTIQNGRALSRSLKLIPNTAVRAFLKKFPALEGLDGELMINGAKLQAVSSVFMTGSAKLPAQWYFGVFDALPKRPGEPFSERYARAVAAVASVAAQTGVHIVVVPQLQVKSVAEVLKFEESALKMGFEGVMLRRASSLYKHGRSTVIEGHLLRWKRFTDGEAEIIGFQESESVPGTLGAFVCRDLKTNVIFKCGTGPTNQQRFDFWRMQDTLLGRVIKYKHYTTDGRGKTPPSAVFLDFRTEVDM